MHCVYTAILIIFEGQLQVFQRFSSSKLVLKTVESCFMALNHYGNGSRSHRSRTDKHKTKTKYKGKVTVQQASTSAAVNRSKFGGKPGFRLHRERAGPPRESK
jgi:hypothetical protein